jgi:hypothetical protein
MTTDELVPLAREAAAELGDAWSVNSDMDTFGVHLHGPDGQRLHFRESRDKRGAVTISPTYPHPTAYYFQGEQHKAINVRADRGARVIAGEIRRRLMPEYVATLAEVRKADERHSAAYAAREKYVAEVYQIIGKDRPVLKDWQQSRAEQDTHSHVDLYGTGGGSGHVDVSFDATTASLEIRYIPAEKVLAILRLLVAS